MRPGNIGKVRAKYGCVTAVPFSGAEFPCGQGEVHSRIGVYCPVRTTLEQRDNLAGRIHWDHQAPSPINVGRRKYRFLLKHGGFLVGQLQVKAAISGRHLDISVSNHNCDVLGAATALLETLFGVVRQAGLQHCDLLSL